MKQIWLLMLLVLVGCVTTPESGRRALIITSEAQENQLGVEAFQEVLRKEQRSTNARWNEILQRVGQRIAQAARKPSYKWEFVLIESKEQNAFCLPGGKVAVYTGILPAMKNEAGMATVIGHEVAHATARHGGQRISTTMIAQGGLVALDAVIGGENTLTKRALMGALGVGATVGAILPFSRANETEADEIGLVYMARAGYDPSEAARFWQRFGKEGGGPPTFLSTHPNSANRASNLQRLLPSVMTEYQSSPKYGIGESFNLDVSLIRNP